MAIVQWEELGNGWLGAPLKKKKKTKNRVFLQRETEEKSGTTSLLYYSSPSPAPCSMEDAQTHSPKTELPP